MSQAWWSRLWWLLPLCAVPVLVHVQLPGLFDGTGVPAERDILYLESSARRWFFSALLDGRLATLYPGTQLGVPLLSVPVYGVMYPVNLLWLLESWLTALALAWHLNALLFVAGWMAALSRLGVGRGASAGAPLLLLASGPMWSFHAVSTLEMASLAWIGWTVWAALVWVDRPRVTAALATGALAAVGLLAGDPWCVPLAILLALLLSLHHLGERRLPRSTWLWGGALAGGAALLVGLPLLVETARFFPFSARAVDISRYEQLAFSSPPARLLELFTPALRLTEEGFARASAGAMVHEPWFPSLTMGFVALALWLLGARYWLRQRPSSSLLVLFPVVVAVLSVGSHSAVTVWLWEHVPPLPTLRFPERMWRYFALGSVPLVAAGLFVLTRRWRHAWLLVVVGIVELTLQQPPPLVADANVRQRVPPELEPLVSLARQGEVRLGVDHRTALSRQGTFAFDTRMWELPMTRAPDTSESPLLKYMPLEYLPTHASLQWLGLSHLVMPRAAPEEQERLRARLGLGAPVDLGPTGFVLVPVHDSSPARGLFLTRLRPAQALSAVAMPDDGPPVGDVRELMRALAEGVFFVDTRLALDPRGGALELSEAPSAGGCAEPASVPLHWDPYLERVRATVDAPCAGVLSLPWRLLPGWRATVDGAPTEVVAINSLTLGVPLPAGRSKVELVWQPAAQPWLLALSWLTLLLIAALALSCALLERRRPTDPKPEQIER